MFRRLFFWIFLLSFSTTSINAQNKQHLIDSLEKILQTDIPDTSRVKVLAKLGGHYLSIDRNKAEEIGKKMLSISKEINYQVGLTTTYTHLGNCYANSGKYDQAREMYNKALEIDKKLNLNTRIATNYSNIGITHRQQGKPNEALKWYEKTLAIQEKIKDTARIVSTYLNIGNALHSAADYAASMEAYKKGLDICEKYNSSSNVIASFYTGLGNIFFMQEDYESAKEYYNSGLEIDKKNSNLGGQCVGWLNLGTVVYMTGDKEESIDYFKKGAEIAEKVGLENQLLTCIMNIGSVHAELGNHDFALEKFKEALPIAEKRGILSAQTTLLSDIAHVYSKKEEYDKAIEWNEKAMQLAKKTNNKNSLITIYKLRSSFYESKGDYNNALAAHKAFVQMKDSVFNEDSKNKILDLQTQYETEKKEKEIKLLDAANKAKELQLSKNKIMLFAAGGGILLLIALGLVILRSNIQKRNANKLLTKQNTEIAYQKEQIEAKNKEIVDSITYAKHLQSAILPSRQMMQEMLPDSFVFYKPKDIVAGDFYWLEHVEDKILFAAADCTGHGVPGAMVSVVCHNALNSATKEFGLTQPAKILDKVRELVIQTFEKSDTDIQDGMDISLCSLNVTTGQLEYAGANNSLYHIHQNNLLEIKADKQPIGKYETSTPFSNHKISAEQGDTIYLFTDGFIDQFGGVNGKKYKSKAFKELLLEHKDQPMKKQAEIISTEFMKWKGDQNQIDDVCVIGVRI